MIRNTIASLRLAAFMTLAFLLTAPAAQAQTHETMGTEVRLGNFACCEGQYQHPGRSSVTIPNGAKFISVRAEMRNDMENCFCKGNFGPKPGKCSPASGGEESCAVGWARMTDYEYSGNTVSANFYNWSDCCTRYARVIATWSY